MQLEDSDSIQILSSLADVDLDVARRVWEKHNGNMEKAADALLSGDKGEVAPSSTWTQRNNTPENGYYDTDVPSITIGPHLPGASQSSLDLNAATVTTTTSTAVEGPKFGPSTRAPNPDWQMVPSDVAVGGAPGISHEDQSLSDAIQRSLDDFKADEKEKEVFPLQETVREGGRPVALRPEIPALACAALVVQGLFFVPQVRFAVANLRLPDTQEDIPLNHPARGIWNLIELFTNMDLAQLSAIVDVEVLPSLEDEADRERINESPAERALAMVGILGRIIDAHMSAQQEDDEPPNRLFEFSHVHVELSNRLPRKVGRQSKGGVVRLDIGGDQLERDLMSCLSSMLSHYEEGKSSHDVILDPSEFLSFCLGRYPTMPNSNSKAEPEGFTFPKSLYLDRFLFRNLEVTNQKHLQSQDIARDISELTNRKTTLSRLNQRNTVQDIKNTIYYYENVAGAKDDPTRQRAIQDTVAQLKDVLVLLENKIEGLDQKIKELRAKANAVFDCPELQQHQYDLRAVLMHTGLPGRKQLYSYVRDVEGTWWKTCDHEVTEVTEEIVLTDSTGVHLSAGPFMLFYSKHLPDEELRKPVNWPAVFANPVEENNRRFLAMLSPEVASKAKIHSPLPNPQRMVTPPRPGQYVQPLRMGPRPANRMSPVPRREPSPAPETNYLA